MTPIELCDKLILEKWDPVGVSGMPEAADEYSQYVLEAYNIIQDSNSYQKLFQFLWEIETVYMGLKGNREKTEKFARALFDVIKQG